MKHIIIFLILALVLSACSTETKKTETVGDNILSEAEKKDGWQLLFDGKSMKGWHGYGNKPVGTAWKVENGTFYLDTTQKDKWQIKNGGDLVSDDEYENFHLKLDWKIAKDGNSGIIFYVNEDTTKYQYVWQTGPEMQILDNAGHPDGKILKHRAGDLYDLISCSKETVKPYGEWNRAEIKSLNGKLDFYLNDTNVVSTTLWDSSWVKMVAESKFKEFPGFGTYKKGKIALQDHGNTVWFKNIKIRKL